MTVGDLIREASIMCGLTSLLTPLGAEEVFYGFGKLNEMVDEFATERLQIYREQRVGPFDVNSGDGNVTANNPITIGVGAMWNTARPVYIDRAGIIYTAGSVQQPELKMKIMTTDEWSRVEVKATTSTLSRALFYDRIFTSQGYGNIYLYPVPSASFKVVLYVPVAVTEFPLDADGNPILTTVIALPPGYRSMLVSNLAVVLALGLLPVSDDLRAQAIRTREKVMDSNVVTHMDALSCDEATRINQFGADAPFDWITGGLN